MVIKKLIYLYKIVLLLDIILIIYMSICAREIKLEIDRKTKNIKAINKEIKKIRKKIEKMILQKNI